MKKILFICPRNPFSGRYSGDVIRAKKFINYFSRNNYVKVLSPSSKNIDKKESKLSYQGFKSSNFLQKIIYILISLFKWKPMQLGYFYSKKIKKYVLNNLDSYDLVFLQSLRVAQYLPENINKKTILDMGDITSKNYYQTSKRLFFLNPLKIIYLLEGFLVEKYENFCFMNFSKILLFSKKEIDSIKSNFKKKVKQISFGIDTVKKKFKYNIKNNKIIFVGNINYTPNKDACYDFCNSILPSILNIDSTIEFHILGEISNKDKFFLSRKKNVKIFGKINNLEPYLKNTICGIANLKISSGIQTKLLTYMSFGIPSICSKQVAENFDLIKESKICSYKNDDEIIKIIFKLKKNKSFANNVSKRSLKTIKKFKWDKVLPALNKVL